MQKPRPIWSDGSVITYSCFLGESDHDQAIIGDHDETRITDHDRTRISDHDRQEYPPSPNHWDHQEIYPILTYGFTHIAIADSISLAIGFFANTYVLCNWGVKLFGRGFFIRSLGATAIGELLFTISTNFITFHYHQVANLAETLNIISSDYLFKMFYSLLICIPNAFIVNKIKQIIRKKDGNNLFVQHSNIVNIKQVRTEYRA